MGSIKLPHASGNSMSIAAPATNPASDLELKLPATIGTAGQVLQNSSTPGTLEFGDGGKILQVVTKNDFTNNYTVSCSRSGTSPTALYGLNNWRVYIDVLGGALTITPKSANSKLILLGTAGMSDTAAAGDRTSSSKGAALVLGGTTGFDSHARYAGYFSSTYDGSYPYPTHMHREYDGYSDTSTMSWQLMGYAYEDSNASKTATYTFRWSQLTIFEVE